MDVARNWETSLYSYWAYFVVSTWLVYEQFGSCIISYACSFLFLTFKTFYNNKLIN